MPGSGHPSEESGHSTSVAEIVWMSFESIDNRLTRSATAMSMYGWSAGSICPLATGVPPLDVVVIGLLGDGLIGVDMSVVGALDDGPVEPEGLTADTSGVVGSVEEVFELSPHADMTTSAPARALNNINFRLAFMYDLERQLSEGRCERRGGAAAP
jgi:hypothetical protein